LRLSPSFQAAREELAGLYGALGRHDDQITELATLVESDPSVSHRLSLADAHLAAGRFDEALKVLAAAEAASPGDSRVSLALGRVYLARAERQPDPDTIQLALTSLESALAGTARRSVGLSLYGRAQWLAGHAATAERLLLEATATSPVDPDAYRYLADAAQQLDHPAIAERALRDLDVLEGDTASPTARHNRHRRLGALALEAGHAAVAVRYLTDAIETGQTDATTLGLLAHARWETGDHTGARTALGQALAQAPDDPGLARLSRTIR
jgi:Flp pilus assembly protein TadD